MFTYYVPGSVVKARNRTVRKTQVPTTVTFTWQWGDGQWTRNQIHERDNFK